MNKKRILYDFYYFILMFAKEIQLEPIQTSVFFSIMKKTHENCISSPYMKLDEDYSKFQDLVLRHSIDRPPFSKKYFTLDQITKITDYATNTYFRHYSMYKYTFTKQQKLNFNTIEIVNNQNTEKESEEEKVINSEKEDQQDTEEKIVDEEANEEVKILETDKSVDKKESEKEIEDKNDKNEEENKEEQNNETTTEEKEIEQKPENKNDEENKEDNKEEQNEENAEEEISPREKAIQDLKVLIETALTPKIQELKATLTTMLSNSEDQLIKQIKKMDEAKKKAAKEAATATKGDKGKDDKKKSAKGKK